MQLTLRNCADGTDGFFQSSFSEPAVWHNLDGTVSAFVYSRNGDHWLHFPGIGRYHLTKSSQEITVVPDPGARHEVVVDTYQRIVVPMRIQQNGDEVIHASGVLMRGAVVGFCGSSGMGKSSVAYALSCRGYSAWSDDVISYQLNGEDVIAKPLPFRIRLRKDAVQFFDIENPETYSKSPSFTMFHPPSGPQHLAKLIVLDRVAEQLSEVSISQLSAEDALRAVLGHAWCFTLDDRERNRLMMQSYLKLIARVPVFRLRFSSGFKNIESVLDKIEFTIP